MNNEIDLQPRSNDVDDRHLSLTKDLSLMPHSEPRECPCDMIEHRFGLQFEHVYYFWYRWHFMTKELFDLTAKHAAEEFARCVRCEFNPSSCFLLYGRLSKVGVMH